jgi:hypothetical protein
MSQEYLDLARRQADGITANAVYEALSAEPRLEVEGDPMICPVYIARPV